MDNFEKENRYIKAKQRVEEEKEFYQHLVVYILVIPFLAFVNYWVDKWNFMWFFFPMIGWGIGLSFHAVKTFRWYPFLGKNWEERKLKEFMAEEEMQEKRWE
ncbi:2TM domain-containing protein [Abyssalbus ytuae]|uniref:2TM domain-containing protein n=1 Tax=Abyssalbus ytuae TaxID=2926907 RepID=A0A9E6ZUW6_9FLAO|nr:2TM domain-containing protein [Abyssalbus ytuae]UOB17221.1 2TM domain-containing protein [Abyssalbus ytuae]